MRESGVVPVVFDIVEDEITFGVFIGVLEVASISEQGGTETETETPNALRHAFTHIHAHTSAHTRASTCRHVRTCAHAVRIMTEGM